MYSIQSSTGVFSGTQLEDSQSEPTVRVSNVMVNLAERTSHGTHISSGRRSVRSGFDFVPEPVEIAAGCAVVPDSVAGVGDPEGSHRDVSLKHGPGLHRTHQQIVLYQVVGLDSVLHKHIMALDPVPDVVLNSQVVNSVQGNNSGH